MKKIGLFAMTEKGLAVLKKILSVFGPEILSFVATSSDKQIAYDGASDIQKIAKKEGIPIYLRPDVPKEKAAAAIAVSWRWMIPASLRTKIVVLHDSILPKYRGFNPLVSALINGERRVGVTAILASDEYDAGPILGQKSISITYPVKIAEAIQATLPCYEELSTLVVKMMLSNKYVARSQNEKKATYSLWRDNYDYQINWDWDAEKVRRFVDAVGFPYKGALTLLEEKKIRLLECEEASDVFIENRDPGKIIFIRGGDPFVVCGRGLLKIKQLVDCASGKNMLPLKKFRIRFG